MKARDILCDILIEAGIDYIFGIPGGATIKIFDSLYDKQDKIKTILTRHEGAAACMADMYGRITGKPGVLLGQGVFVASNGSVGIMESFQSNSPMLVLGDVTDEGFAQHSRYQSGSGEYGALDIREICKSFSKYTCHAVTAEEVVHGVQLAIKHATSGRMGPASVIMRSKAIDDEVDTNQIPKIYPTSGYLKKTPTIPPAEEIRKAVDLISAARRPVIIAGNGVHMSKAYDELLNLVEILGIPVATSYKGKSAIAESHPLAVGMMGTFGQKTANRIIADSDLILVAGCHLAPNDTMGESQGLIDPEKQKIVQIDIDPRNTGWIYPIEMALVGELNLVLQQIIMALPAIDEKKKQEYHKIIQQRKQKEKYYQDEDYDSEAVPIMPQRLIREIEDVIDESTIVTLDAGKNRLYMAHLLKAKSPGSIFSPGGIASMGWGPPAALTAKLLYPDRPVLSVSGDGGFGMVIQVLSTAIQYELPVVFLVINDSRLGWIHDDQGSRNIATEFIKTDYAQIAKAFGCNGINVNSPEGVGPALRESMNSTIPTVIDVTINPSEHLSKIADDL